MQTGGNTSCQSGLTNISCLNNRHEEMHKIRSSWPITTTFFINTTATIITNTTSSSVKHSHERYCYHKHNNSTNTGTITTTVPPTLP
ncbi:hypothetical protein PoB_007551700 [Plakobranchus ocellatus]|uniref:Uncharacterized protein n=1 Tax=Plakobranchus ocellatus TaxID=259542 RepID=A0AAV4DYA6_9GAST|nr:hypothetical protein PoB_007551700 [Plakobranchus ocellatus]